MRLPFQVTKNVTLLGSELFNLYLVKGETYAIVEGAVSGVTYPFLEQLKQLNIPPETISHLVILHSHFDHMMVFPTLKGKYPWMKIVSSELNRSIFSNERILAKIFDSDRKMTLALEEAGIISKAPTLQPSCFFPLDIAVSEGFILDLGGGVRMKFLTIPGHSPDCLAAFIEEEGLLFSSDGAGFYTPPDFFRPNYWYRLGEAEKSLDKIRTLDPEILCRGHYGAFVGRDLARKHLQMNRQSIEDFKAFVLEKINTGWSVEEITKDINQKFSRGFLEFFPAEENYRLWKLLVQRTLEHFGIEMEEKH
ncbi:MAG TPA: MBL fold metallo-hydrolase [Thermodesulfobacteriota bacterium]|nr:MBL fold metallo-hydrolase [Thermodesulfobacteriota bacterium]